MDGGGILLVILAMVGAVALFLIGWFAFKRFAGPADLDECRIRCVFRRMDGTLAWRRGELRFNYERLALVTQAGRPVAADTVWPRPTLDLGASRELPGEELVGVEGLAGGAPPGLKACTVGDGTWEIGLGGDSLTALRSWHEASPPGWNANVA